MEAALCVSNRHTLFAGLDHDSVVTMGRWAGPKYPEGPPSNYDPENPHADPVALLENREYEVRRKEVGVAKAQVHMQESWSKPLLDVLLGSILNQICTHADSERKSSYVLHQRGCQPYPELQTGRIA